MSLGTLAKEPAVRPLTPSGTSARPGMTVRQQLLADPAGTPPHKIVSKEIVPGASPGEERYVIATTQGSWEFRGDEPVVFPRRPDGSMIDWRGRRPPPTPLDLAIGDWLDPSSGLDPDLPEMTRVEATQRVTAVTRSRIRPDVVSINTHSAWEGVRHWTFAVFEQVIFPRPEGRRPTGRDEHRPQLDGYGPYARGSDAYFLVTHPSGGGRWPAWLADPIKIAEGVFLAKPPRESWSEYQFGGDSKWERHPQDPKWGKVGHTIVVLDREMTRVVEAYQSFRETQSPT